jgi:putative transposase
MKSLKIRIELNNEQTTLARKHAGIARYAYNWALARCKKTYAEKVEAIPYKRPSSVDLHKMWVAEVKSENKWTYETSKCSPQQAFRNLDGAYKRAFTVKSSQLPTFKKKGVNDSFYLEGAISIKEGSNGCRLKLPKFGLVNCSERLPEVDIKNVVVSRQANHWFVSFKILEVPEKIVGIEQKQVIGVDLGIKTLATLSDGKTFENNRPYKKFKRKLRLAQRKVSKKFVKGAKPQSKNYKKASQKVAKIHYKISCIRKDSLHKLTTYLAKNHSEIVIEDLNVKGMSKNHKLASAILDGGFYEFKRQIDYKTKWYGSKMTVVDRFFPSSKTCSNCQSIKQDLTLKDRTYKCQICGMEKDRDLNAAINLREKAVSYTVLNACGEVNKPKARRLRTSTKQETNRELL